MRLFNSQKTTIRVHPISSHCLRFVSHCKHIKQCPTSESTLCWFGEHLTHVCHPNFKLHPEHQQKTGRGTRNTEVKTRRTEPTDASVTTHLQQVLVSLDWQACRSNLHQSVSRAAAAGLKGVVLVSPIELHSLDPVASHASLKEGDVSKTEKVGGSYSQMSQVEERGLLLLVCSPDI